MHDAGPASADASAGFEDGAFDIAMGDFIAAESRAQSAAEAEAAGLTLPEAAEPATAAASRRATRSETSGADPYAVLAEYERRSFEHVAANIDVVHAAGLWRGIGFRVGERRLMASITEVFEILPVLHHTTVPGTQSWLLGVVNVRGTLMPLIDLRRYIEGERTPLGDTSRLLVARHGANPIGLLVEEVLGQRSLTVENDPLRLEGDSANWARFVPAHFELEGNLWGVFSIAALVTATDFLYAAA